MATRDKAREQKQLRREATREERLKGRQHAEARRRQRERIIYAGIALAAVAIIGLLGWSAFGPKPPLPGEQIPGQGQTHISLGAPHPAYNSNPPTSGWHTGDRVAPSGVHGSEIPDEIVVHSLEHGCIWISYKDPKDTDLVTKLETLAAKNPVTVVMTPRPKNDSAIAVAAWQRLLKLTEYNEGQIVAFIRAFRNKGPEALNCSGGTP